MNANVSHKIGTRVKAEVISMLARPNEPLKPRVMILVDENLEGHIILGVALEFPLHTGDHVELEVKEGGPNGAYWKPIRKLKEGEFTPKPRR